MKHIYSYYKLISLVLYLLSAQLTFAQSTEAIKTTRKKQVYPNSINSVNNTFKATKAAKPAGLKNFSVKQPSLDPPYSYMISSTFLCGGESLELTAECASGTAIWYDAEYGGSLVGQYSPLNVTPTSTAPYYVACENNGVESERISIGEVIVISAPTDVQADNAYVCSGDDVSLTANCASGTIFWYDQAEGGNFLDAGAPLIQNPTSAITYYATCKLGDCESERIATNTIEVGPSSTDEPANVHVDKTNVCAHTTVTLTANCATGEPIWYKKILGGSSIGTGVIFIQNPDSTTTYYAACPGDPCPGSRVATEEVVIIPVEDLGSSVVLADIPSGLCAGTLIKLTGNCQEGGTPTWYITSDPNPIGIGDTLIHKVTVERNNYSMACLQGTCNYFSTGVPNYTLGGMVSEGPPPPINVQVSSESICAGTSVYLFATCNPGETIIWYTQPFEGSPIGTGESIMHRPTVSTTYFALCQDSDGVCESVRAPTEHVEVLASSASMPTEVSVDKTYVPAGTEVILTANCANGESIWYDQEFDGSPVVYGTNVTQNPTVTTTYYAACTGDPCETLRVATDSVTILAEPTEVRVSTISICVEGSISLTASCTEGTIEWYNQASDGEPIGTGSPLLVSLNESTTYYAACQSGGFSGNRVSTAQVTVYQLPETPTDALGSKTAIISGEPVLLSATCNIGNVIWYNQLTGGTPIGMGSSLVYYPATTITYYASCKNGNCESSRASVPEISVTVMEQVPYMVKDIFLDSGYSDIRNKTNVNGMLYFSATDLENGQELWKSDGTEAGTTLIKDIHTGGDSYPKEGSYPQNLTNINGILYFSAFDDNGINEIWKSDGILSGTERLMGDESLNFTSVGPENLININGTLYFTSYEVNGGFYLSKSDGTASGTVRIKELRDNSDSSLNPSLVNLNGTLYFSENNGQNGNALWKSDGTPQGTEVVRLINAEAGNMGIDELFNINGFLYFSFRTEDYKYYLWKSDGTTEGTIKIKEANSNHETLWSSPPKNLTYFDGALFLRLLME